MVIFYVTVWFKILSKCLFLNRHLCRGIVSATVYVNKTLPNRQEKKASSMLKLEEAFIFIVLYNRKRLVILLCKT
jgi:hypothetical protein